MILRLVHRLYLMLRRPVRWARHRFTVTGAFVLAGMLMTGSASNPAQTMGLQVFVVLVALMTVAVVLAPFFRVRFSLARQAPRFVTAGEAFTLRVTLRNLGRRAQRGLEYLENVQDTPLTFHEFAARLRSNRGTSRAALSDPMSLVRSAQTKPALLPFLPSQGLAEVRAEIIAHRRGPLLLAGGMLARTDPFGLFRGFCRVESPQTVLVLPRRYPLPPFALPGQSHYQRGGVAMAAGVGESEEFVALREYRRGDSLRRVHWRSAARLGKLVVKEFQDEYFMRHALVLDTFCAPPQDGMFEEAVAVAASFACTVPDQESLLDLMFVGPQTVCVTSGRGVGHAQQMLEVLAAVQPCRQPRYGELEALVLQHSVTLSGCLLLFLDWDQPRRALVRRLKALRVPVWVLLMRPSGRADDFEAGPPEDQPDRLILLESGNMVEGLRRLEDAT